MRRAPAGACIGSNISPRPLTRAAPTEGRRSIFVLILSGLLATMPVTTPAASTAVEAMRLAAEAGRAADVETSIAKLEEAVAVRPDFVHLVESLATAQVTAGRPADAIATLERLAIMGLHLPVERAAEFAPLRTHQGFQAVVKRFAANLHPRGAGEVAFSLGDVTGLIEGIAWRAKTGEFYFGDANARCIWIRGKDGALRRLTPAADELWGVFGIAIDESTGAIWAATSAVPAMQGFTSDLQGMAALAEIDLESGVIRRTIPVAPRPGPRTEHALTDVAVAADGTVLVTDSSSPILWRLAPAGVALEAWVESDEFFSLEGITVATEGVALVSDRANGLLRVDLADRSVRQLVPPPETSLLDIEGLVFVAPTDAFALQGGLRPTRVLRVVLDPTVEEIRAVHVMESGHMSMAAPSRGCLATGGDFFYIGFAGRARFESGEPAKPRSVPIFRTKLAAGKR